MFVSGILTETIWSLVIRLVLGPVRDSAKILMSPDALSIYITF